jgi:hypothetical protein
MIMHQSLIEPLHPEYHQEGHSFQMSIHMVEVSIFDKVI